MIKKHLKKLIISSVITLSPIIFGLIFWNNFPDVMSTHWGIDGTADGSAGRIFAVFGLPLIMAVLNILCVIITVFDNKNRNQSPKALNIIFFIMPVISIFSSAVIYLAALGKIWNYFAIFPVLIGAIFVVLGNIMPKLRQNHTFGIKLKWTFESEKNWNATHRFSGKVWVITGLLMMLTAFLPYKIMFICFFTLLIASILTVAVYSYVFHKKEAVNGTEFSTDYNTKAYKSAKRTTSILLPLVLIFVAVIMFTGNITVEYTDKSIILDSVYYDKLNVKFDEIDSAELAENSSAVKEFGFNNIVVNLGGFQNEQYGSHTRYTYNKCKSVVLIKSDGKTLLINAKTENETKEIYNKILTEIGE